MKQPTNSPFWSPIVDELTPYVPGEQPKAHLQSPLIKLNTNENPYPPSPAVSAAIKAEADQTLRLYPDPNSDALCSALARYFSLTSDQVFVGNGSDEVLAHIFPALLNKSQPILFPDITYSFYPVYSQLYRVEFQTVPLKADFSIDTDDFQWANGGIIFPNPNAPTGRLLPIESIRACLEHQLHANPTSVVVVDEAYIDFGGVSAACLIDEYPNLLVVQTLSKSRSLAGLRVGFALGQAHLIEALNRVKNSFNSYPIDRLALVGAVAAIEDQVYFEQCCAQVISTRHWTENQLKSLGFEVIPSYANFLMTTHPQYSADQLASALRQANIIVRHFKLPRIQQYLRITIGTQEEMNRFIAVLREIIIK